MDSSKVWIQTRTGLMFDLLSPTPEMVSLQDIAAALAKYNRYTGHTTEPYSVAQHSIFVSRHVSPAAAPYGLLHDAEEAYTGDMATPMKSAMERLGGGHAHRCIVQGIRKAIFERFGLTYPPPTGIWLEVKAADALALATEKRDMLEHVLPWDYPMPEPCPTRLTSQYWRLAEAEFLDRAAELGLR